MSKDGGMAYNKMEIAVTSIIEEKDRLTKILEALEKEWKSANEFSEKHRFATTLSGDEYIFLKAKQEVRNIIARIMVGEFTGDNFETSKEKVDAEFQRLLHREDSEK